jgi:hypothetical protein
MTRKVKPQKQSQDLQLELRIRVPSQLHGVPAGEQTIFATSFEDIREQMQALGCDPRYIINVIAHVRDSLVAAYPEEYKEQVEKWNASNPLVS